MNYHKINIYYLVIFIACFNCTFVISTTKSKAFYSVTPNRKLSNFSAIHTSTTRIRCITKCLGDMKCRYVSYLPLNGECQHSELEPNGATVILDIADGWESYAGKINVRITIYFTSNRVIRIRVDGRGFDPHVRQHSFVEFGHENHVYGHSLPSAESRRAVVNNWRKNVH